MMLVGIGLVALGLWVIYKVISAPIDISVDDWNE